MSDKVDNEVIANYLKEFIIINVDDFGYLLKSDNAKLNNKALRKIKDKFKKFLDDCREVEALETIEDRRRYNLILSDVIDIIQSR